jgi:cytochrome c-type biogenesis protein CcmH
MIRAIPILFAALLSQMAMASPAKLSHAAVEARGMALQKEFRCLVCQGESLDESNAPLAEDLRQLIRERIVAGDSDEAVKQYLVARYGPFILMRPPVENDTYLLWLAPVLLITAGGAVLLLVASRAKARFRASGASAVDHVLGTTDPKA